MKKTLVVMAAGMGSRFGGLKQLEPIGPNGEFIIDYSVYDAIKAGFDKVVFVIKDEIYDDFRNTIGKRLEGHVEVKYVFQRLNDIPGTLPVDREKPWGTGQAILSSKEEVKTNFVVINSDDFYGRKAYLDAAKALEKINDKNFGIVGYKAENTLTENGSVKRGVLTIEEGKILKITESIMLREDDIIHCENLVSGEKFDVSLGALVSMNMFLFSPKIYEFLENDFAEFFKNLTNPLKDEFLIPVILDNHIKNGDVTVDAIKTDSIWYGITYKEDKEYVKDKINELIEKKEYPSNLWK